MVHPDQPLLEVEDLTVRFTASRGVLRRETVDAVDGLSIALQTGESLGLVGESGSGKTTLARVIVKLVRPHSGRVLFKGEDIFDMDGKATKGYRRKVQMIFQDPYESLNPRSTTWKAVEGPLLIHNIVRGKSAINKTITNLVRMVGLEPSAVMKKYPHQLSGGERQRVSIARALAVSPELLVADEPVSMLDVSIRIGILDLLLDLKRKLDLTYLFITHDLGVARYFCDRIAVMYRGRVMEVAEADELLRRPFHPYTKLLIDSVPEPGGAEMPAQEGAVTDKEGPVTGCKFNPRCPYAQDVCRVEAPGLSEAGKGHWVACYFPLSVPERVAGADQRDNR